jgi:hypothetical protein
VVDKWIDAFYAGALSTIPTDAEPEEGPPPRYTA